MSRIYSSIIVTALLLPLLVGGLLHPRYAYAAAVCSVQPTTISNSSQPFNFTASGLDANKSYQIFLNGVGLPSNRSDPSGNISTTITPAQFLGPIVSKIVVQLKQFPGSYVCNQGGTNSNLIVTVTVPAPPPDAKYYRCNPDKRICEETTRGAVGASTDKAQCDSTCAQTGTTFTPTAPIANKQPQGSGLLFQSNSCTIDVASVSTNFLGDVIGDGGKAVGLKLIAQKGASGFLSKIPIVGGIVEGFDKIADFILSSWLTAVSWGLFATLLAGITASLTQYALTLNAAIATSNSVVSVGFGIILTLVNMGFVAGLIVMALATMLRWEEWGLKNLPRFILAAILINFSLFFAGAILAVSTKVIEAFLDSGACTGTFLTKFNIATINQSLESIATTAGGVSGMVLSTLSLYLASLITLIGALSFAAIFLFLIARYVMVTILLIFMPISWLGFAFPKLNFPAFGSAWSGWWNEFIKWVITGPIIAFFIYLSTYLVTNLGSITITGSGIVQPIGQMLAVVAISLGGLFVAGKMGGVGSALITGAMGLGLGAATGQWTKFMERQQLAAETRSKIYPTGVRGFGEKLLAKSFKATASAPGLIFTKPLAQAGVKLPEGKKLTQAEQREERAKQLLGRLEKSPLTVLQFTSGDLTEFSRNGSEDDKDKINQALISSLAAAPHLDPLLPGPFTPLQTKQRNNYERIGQQIRQLGTKGEW